MNINTSPFIPSYSLDKRLANIEDQLKGKAFFIEDIRRKTLENGIRIEKLCRKVNEYMESVHTILLRNTDEIAQLREEIYNKTLYLQQILEELGKK